MIRELKRQNVKAVIRNYICRHKHLHYQQTSHTPLTNHPLFSNTAHPARFLPVFPAPAHLLINDIMTAEIKNSYMQQSDCGATNDSTGNNTSEAGKQH